MATDEREWTLGCSVDSKGAMLVILENARRGDVVVPKARAEAAERRMAELDAEVFRLNKVALDDRAKAEAAEQRVRELEEPSGCHPCCDCGDDYGRWGSWLADDAVWRAVTGGDPTLVLCPLCFAKRAEAKLATAVEALRWYGDEDHWTLDVLVDGGERARQALSEIEGDEQDG